MDSTPARRARPQQVTLGGWVALVSAALLVASVYDALAGLRSLDTRTAIAQALDTASGRSLDLTVEQATALLHDLLVAAGAAAAVAAVLGWFVLQGNRAARVVLTGLGIVLVFASLAADPVFGIGLAFAVGLLWSRPARDWFAGREPVAAAVLQAEGPRDEGADRPAGGHEERPLPPPTIGYGGYAGQQGQPGDQGQQGRPHQPGPPVSPYGPPGPPPYPFGPGGYPPGPPYGPPPRSGSLPGTVRAAAVVTWILSGLSLAVLVVAGFGLATDRGPVLDRLMQLWSDAGSGTYLTRNDLATLLWAVIVVGGLWCVLAIVLAGFVWRGRGWARIALTVCSALAGLVGLVSLPGSILNVAGCVAVIALLFSRSARSWFSGSARHGVAGGPGGYGGPPGPWPGPWGHGPQHPGQHPGHQGHPGPPTHQGQWPAYPPPPPPYAGPGAPPPPGAPPAYPGPGDRPRPPEGGPDRPDEEPGRDGSQDPDRSGDKPVW